MAGHDALLLEGDVGVAEVAAAADDEIDAVSAADGFVEAGDRRIGLEMVGVGVENVEKLVERYRTIGHQIAFKGYANNIQFEAVKFGSERIPNKFN